MKKFLSVLLTNTFIFLILLLFTEFLVRLIFPEIQIPCTDKLLFKKNVYYSSSGLAPDAAGYCYSFLLKVNSNSFWRYAGKNKGKPLLYLGDSVTMGIGAESDSTFAGIVNNEQKIISVFNPSRIGYSSIDYVNIIKKLIEEDNNRYNISGVSLFWCLNDVYDKYPDGITPEILSEGFLGEAIELFKKNFKLFYLFKNTFTDRQRAYYEYDEKFYKDNNKLLENAIKNVSNISEVLKQRQIPFIVYLLPYEYQLRKNIYHPQKLLLDSLALYNINAVDLSPLFKKNNDPSDLYLYGDGIHLSNKGHRAVAEFLKKRE